MQIQRSNGFQSFPYYSSGEFGFKFSFAFQPIVDAPNQEIISFEALVRGPHGEPSDSVFAQVNNHDFGRFDEICRQKAIHLASRLNIPNSLCLNLSAQGLYQIDSSIITTFHASMESGIPTENIIFEVLETANLTDQYSLLQYLKLINEFGFKTSIDDFGAGYSGLKLLVKYQPTYIKLDRHLIGDIQENPVKQSVFMGIRQICTQLSIEIVAEGVEQAAEYRWLSQAGVKIFQGYYFARPAFEALPDVSFKAYAI
ncbi:MAG: EAL domain-containing protein [Anaerolineales bacterium]|jgi:EAL domain-containing protein (putative c-di-GMP-specific phosphodiesterase class I)